MTADQLATAADLGNLLGVTVDAGQAGVLLECATAVVQEAAGRQRLVAVAGDVLTIMGTTDSWLDLPQRPVTAVASVVLDGVTLTAGAAGSGGATYRRVGDRLWRGDGWQTYAGEPSSVVVTHSHGFTAGVQDLQLARSAVLGLVRPFVDNTTGAVQVRIDDYAATYDAMMARMEASPYLARALERQYGRRAGLVRLG
jgi:hypothetical protein